MSKIQAAREAVIDAVRIVSPLSGIPAAALDHINGKLDELVAAAQAEAPPAADSVPVGDAPPPVVGEPTTPAIPAGAAPPPAVEVAVLTDKDIGTLPLEAPAAGEPMKAEAPPQAAPATSGPRRKPKAAPAPPAIDPNAR